MKSKCALIGASSSSLLYIHWSQAIYALRKGWRVPRLSSSASAMNRKKIARFALRLLSGEPQGPVTYVAHSLRHMADLCADMLRTAVRALDETDIEKARHVIARDVELDEEFGAAIRQLLTLAMEGAPYLRATIDTVFALKGLERIGDHSKNIAEQ